jgi:hypothetical protein
MPFACCLCCGNVVERTTGVPDYGKPAGPCPRCSRTMYASAVPFAEIVVRQRAVRAHWAPETQNLTA